jgi:hypothetical protein
MQKGWLCTPPPLWNLITYSFDVGMPSEARLLLLITAIANPGYVHLLTYLLTYILTYYSHYSQVPYINFGTEHRQVG